MDAPRRGSRTTSVVRRAARLTQQLVQLADTGGRPAPAGRRENVELVGELEMNSRTWQEGGSGGRARGQIADLAVTRATRT